MPVCGFEGRRGTPALLSQSELAQPLQRDIWRVSLKFLIRAKRRERRRAAGLIMQQLMRDGETKAEIQLTIRRIFSIVG